MRHAIAIHRTSVWQHEQINSSFYKQNNRGPAAARNMGAKHAKGDFLTFTDDDCTPASDWLFSLAVRFALSPKCFITGRTVNNLPNNLFAAVSQCLIEYLYSFFNTIPEQAQFCTSNNMAIPTNCFRKLDKFDTTYTRAAGEDRELCDRWLYQGGLILYAPEVVVYHAHSLTLLTFWQQHFGYDRASFRFHKMQAKRNNNLLRIESKRFYYNLLLSV